MFHQYTKLPSEIENEILQYFLSSFKQINDLQLEFSVNDLFFIELNNCITYHHFDEEHARNYSTILLAYSKYHKNLVFFNKNFSFVSFLIQKHNSHKYINKQKVIKTINHHFSLKPSNITNKNNIKNIYRCSYLIKDFDKIKILI